MAANPSTCDMDREGWRRIKGAKLFWAVMRVHGRSGLHETLSQKAKGEKVKAGSGGKPHFVGDLKTGNKDIAVPAYAMAQLQREVSSAQSRWWGKSGRNTCSQVSARSAGRGDQGNT